VGSFYALCLGLGQIPATRAELAPVQEISFGAFARCDVRENDKARTLPAQENATKWRQ
jgi:hypothetical protein